VNSGEPSVQAGAVIRRGTRGLLANGIMVNFPVGLDVDSNQTYTNYNDGTLRFRSIFLDNTANFATDGDNPGNPALGVPAFTPTDNIVQGNETLSGFTFIPGTPGIVPGASEQAVTPFDVTGIGDLEPTTYIGAIENADDDWYVGWTIDINGNPVN
jgi:hypothetical protein